MSNLLSRFGASALLVVGLGATTALAQGGPCTDDITKLTRQLGTQTGLGAPVSEPSHGQRTGSNETAGQPSTTGTAQPVGTPETDRAQKGGASRESGGTPGTVGGVAGPTGATGQADAVASGRIATSPEDVRRQSENRPTAAAAASQGGDAKASPGLSPEDKVSQAKTALQRAVDLNAKGDQACADAVKQVRALAPEQGR